MTAVNNVPFIKTINKTMNEVKNTSGLKEAVKTFTNTIDRIITIQNEDTVAKNYYPVSTAIAVRDASTQMTIMNDRTQGGTSLTNGTIELMQNRRILADDQKGMFEPLDEYDDYGGMIGLRYSAQQEYPGTGIITNAKYYIEVFSLRNNKGKSPSAQRKVQQTLASPAQMFFSFEKSKPEVKNPT